MVKQHLLEAALDNAEVFIDRLIDNEIVKDVPMLGTALKVCRAGMDLRDRMFAAKIGKFVTNLDAVNEETKVKIKQKMVENHEATRKIGEMILLTLEKLTDLDKPEIIAKVFLAYIDGHLTNKEFRRLIEVIDLSFIDDLNVFLQLRNPPMKSKEAFLRYLARSGVTEVVAGQTWNDSGELYYEVTRLGNKLINAYRHGGKLVG